MTNWFEFRYSLRVLMKSPGHTAMCALIVALSLSVGMIALTLVYNLLYKPLPFAGDSEWVHLTRISSTNGVSDGVDTIDSFHYQFLKDHNTVFAELGAIRAFSESRMKYGESATRISSAEITPHIFAESGLSAHLGRSLQAADSQSDNQVAVINYSLWQNYFSGDPDIVGKTVEFDEMPLTIVGVMPAGTAFGMKHDVWIANQSWLANRPDANNIRTITPVGVLKPNISLATAQNQLSQLTRQMQEQYPDFYSGVFAVKVSPFRQFLMEDSSSLFVAVAVFSCIVVVLGAINIANLLISRAIERRKEFAIRNCVGSSNLDLFRQSLQETLVLCGFGLLLALPLTLWGMAIINSYLQNAGNAMGWSVPPAWILRLDTAALVIALSILTAIWLICGLGPAFKLRRSPVSEVLSGGKGGTEQTSFRSTKILVGTQIIASFFLLIVSGSLLIAILGIVNTDYGLETNNRYVVDLEFPSTYRSADKRIQTIEAIESQLRQIPSLHAVTTVAGLPHRAAIVPFAIRDRNLSVEGVAPRLQASYYSQAAFEILGVNLLEGRHFDNTDTNNPVLIVDRDFARQAWPGESAIGREVEIPVDSGRWLRVVGVSEPVVPGMQFGNFNRENTAYVPMSKVRTNEVEVVIETTTPQSIAEVFSWVRLAAANTDGQIAVYNPRSMQEHLVGPTYGLQMLANIFIAFGVLAVVLAVVGVFAVISRSVLQQTRNIGIRRAVGSSNHSVLRLYFKQGCAYLITGAVIGGGAAVIINSALASFFVDLPTTTPLVALFVLVGLGAMVTLASLLPTQKALKYEPGEALHQS